MSWRRYTVMMAGYWKQHRDQFNLIAGGVAAGFGGDLTYEEAFGLETRSEVQAHTTDSYEALKKRHDQWLSP